MNNVVEVVFSSYRYPTLASWIASRFINKSEDMVRRMREYFSGDKDPYFIEELYKPIVRNTMDN